MQHTEEQNRILYLKIYQTLWSKYMNTGHTSKEVYSKLCGVYLLPFQEESCLFLCGWQTTHIQNLERFNEIEWIIFISLNVYISVCLHMHMYTHRRVANPVFSVDLVGTVRRGILVWLATAGSPNDTTAGACSDAYMVNHDRAHRPPPLPDILWQQRYMKHAVAILWIF